VPSFVLAGVWTLVAACSLLPGGVGPSYTSFSYAASSTVAMSRRTASRWSSWDRQQARCPGYLVAEVGARVTCTAGSGGMTRAGVYARISRDPEGEALGVERQRLDCLDRPRGRAGRSWTW
jgi:hypothetical protein